MEDGKVDQVKVLEALGFEDASAMLACGVYVLLWQGEVMYVGQSKHVWRRVYAHRNGWFRFRREGKPNQHGVRFDQVFVLECREYDLDRLETEMIAKLKPRKNTAKVPKPNGLTIDLVALGLIEARPAPMNRRI